MADILDENTTNGENENEELQQETTSTGGAENTEGAETQKTEDDPEYDEELEAMKRKVKEMQQEAERLDELQKKMADEGLTSASASEKADSKEADSRSIYVGNVDYGATPEELQTHFQSCGTINRVTILCDKWTGHPKGFAYIEFQDSESVANAVVLNETMFRGRQIKVNPKRTNVPGLSRGGFRGGFRGRGRGFYGYRGRGRRGFYHPYMM